MWLDKGIVEGVGQHVRGAPVPGSCSWSTAVLSGALPNPTAAPRPRRVRPVTWCTTGMGHLGGHGGAGDPEATHRFLLSGLAAGPSAPGRAGPGLGGETSYLPGVLTRRVEKLVEQVGVASLSKSQVSEMATYLDAQVEAFRNRPLDGGPYPFVGVDALAIKVREGGRTVNVHVLIAVGVNADGHREVLGLDVAASEDGAGWLAFLRSLTARGLTGVQLVISDAHRGMVDAIAATLPGASWQRCRTHYLCNLLTRVPKSAQPWVATMVRTVFDQPDTASVHAQYTRVEEAIEARFPDVAAHLDEARADPLAFTAFPHELWRQIWSNNPRSG